MACTAHVNLTSCTGHVNSCPAHAGYVAPVTPTVWTDPILDTTDNIKAVHHNELRTAISAELVRRSKTATLPALEAVGGVIDRYGIALLRNAIVAARAWAYPTALSNTYLIAGQPVLKDQFNPMRTEVNSQEIECVCNCNYACTCQCNYTCTCDCNYCTCDCNYCTCNCNYCTCQCNYACTCDCNYSDRRLKKDIVYM